jgi:hypothetical protein
MLMLVTMSRCKGFTTPMKVVERMHAIIHQVQLGDDADCPALWVNRSRKLEGVRVGEKSTFVGETMRIIVQVQVCILYECECVCMWKSSAMATLVSSSMGAGGGDHGFMATGLGLSRPHRCQCQTLLCEIAGMIEREGNLSRVFSSTLPFRVPMRRGPAPWLIIVVANVVNTVIHLFEV